MKTLSLKEQSLIDQIISAAHERNWEAFRSLSEKPFENESSMREQFHMSADQLAAMNIFEIEAEAVDTPEGGRMIYANLVEAKPGDQVITLILHGEPTAGEGRFGIWVFAPMPEW